MKQKFTVKFAIKEAEIFRKICQSQRAQAYEGIMPFVEGSEFFNIQKLRCVRGLCANSLSPFTLSTHPKGVSAYGGSQASSTQELPKAVCLQASW